MKTFKGLTALQKTLVVFWVSVTVCVPLIILVSATVESEFWAAVEISALGWFAGGAIVGNYIYWRSRERGPRN